MTEPTARPELPTGIVTLLFSDIEGSTRLAGELGERYGELLDAHHRLLLAAFRAHRGHEFGTQGDAFFVAFARPDDAAAAAASVQRVLARHRWPEQATRALLSGDALDGAVLRDLGEHRLKDLPEREWLFELVRPDLPNEHPPLKTLNNTNLPVPASPLVGRVRELEQLAALLARADVRLLTLTGGGGAGKTRLALALAAELVERYRNGVFFVALAAVREPALVLPSMTQALGVREVPGQALADTLTDHLS